MPFSPWAMPDVPDVDLASFVLRHAVRLADRPALIDGERVVTYGELAERSSAPPAPCPAATWSRCSCRTPRFPSAPGRPARGRRGDAGEPALHRARARRPAAAHGRRARHRGRWPGPPAARRRPRRRRADALLERHDRAAEDGPAHPPRARWRTSARRPCCSRTARASGCSASRRSSTAWGCASCSCTRSPAARPSCRWRASTSRSCCGRSRARRQQALVPPPLLAALAHHPLVDSFDLSSLRMSAAAARRPPPRSSARPPRGSTASSPRATASPRRVRWSRSRRSTRRASGPARSGC